VRDNLSLEVALSIYQRPPRSSENIKAMLTSLIGAHSRVRIGVPSASRLAFAVADGRGAFRTLSAALVAATPSATTPTPGENDAVVAFPSTSYALRRWRVDHRTTAATACVSSLSGAAVAHSSPSSSCYHSSYHRRRHPPSRPSCATWSIVSGRSHHARAMPFSSFSSSTATDASVKNDERFRDGKPTLEYAMTLPKTFASMTNEQVLHFAELSIPEACRECVVRDIMSVDRVEYDEVRMFVGPKGLKIYFSDTCDASSRNLLSHPRVYRRMLLLFYSFIRGKRP
jgi:hypothetical protein